MSEDKHDKVEEVKSKRAPGRPRKCQPKKDKFGIVDTPTIEGADCEIIVQVPDIFKIITSFNKTLAPSGITGIQFVFKKDGFYIYSKSQNEKTFVQTYFPGKDAYRYYCNEEKIHFLSHTDLIDVFAHISKISVITIAFKNNIIRFVTQNGNDFVAKSDLKPSKNISSDYSVNGSIKEYVDNLNFTSNDYSASFKVSNTQLKDIVNKIEKDTITIFEKTPNNEINIRYKTSNDKIDSAITLKKLKSSIPSPKYTVMYSIKTSYLKNVTSCQTNGCEVEIFFNEDNIFKVVNFFDEAKVTITSLTYDDGKK